MKYRIEVERSAIAALVIEADNLEQATSKAFAKVRDADFGNASELRLTNAWYMADDVVDVLAKEVTQ
jgi:hypothetical protein